MRATPWLLAGRVGSKALGAEVQYGAQPSHRFFRSREGRCSAAFSAAC
jgi:hypothetical protein